MEWLFKKELVYGYMLLGQLWDIGATEGYKELKRTFDKLQY